MYHAVEMCSLLCVGAAMGAMAGPLAPTYDARLDAFGSTRGLGVGWCVFPCLALAAFFHPTLNKVRPRPPGQDRVRCPLVPHSTHSALALTQRTGSRTSAGRCPCTWKRWPCCRRCALSARLDGTQPLTCRRANHLPALVPQIYLFHRQIGAAGAAGTIVQPLIGHTVFAVGFSRLFELAFWCGSYRELTDGTGSPWPGFLLLFSQAAHLFVVRVWPALDVCPVPPDSHPALMIAPAPPRWRISVLRTCTTRCCCRSQCICLPACRTTARRSRDAAATPLARPSRHLHTPPRPVLLRVIACN